ncbi:Mur ligase family protein [Flavobacteriaceae bacterium]|nr:Mur ligase family protein [Flavobacteriaceae bacterium]
MVYLPHWPKNLHNDFGQDSVNKLKNFLPKIGNPHLKLPPIVHVAGTNGKGSTISFLESILKAHGYSCHVFTSPHVFHCNERIKINEQKISDQYLFELLEKIRSKSNEINFTLFEALTLVAILAFARHKADFCLIETGMGGRVDSTNVLENKIVTILTSISLDHEEFLGFDVKTIAAQKAHIMRKGTPNIMMSNDTEILDEIRLRSDIISNDLLIYNQGFSYKKHGDKFDFISSDQRFYDLPLPNLLGEHQLQNACAAIAAVSKMKINISTKNISEGLKNVSWHFRLEKLNNNFNRFLQNPKSEIWFDAAHNIGGAESIAKWLQNEKEIQTFLIIGFSKNKTKKEFLLPFVNLVECFLPIQVEGEPLPEITANIAKILQKIGVKYHEKDDLLEAIYFAGKKARTNECRIIICGSIYLAADIKKYNSYLS